MDNSSDSYSELPPPIFNRDPGDEVDLDAEMRKQPEDRAPGTFNELLRQGMEFGVAQGDISEEEAKRMFDLMQQHGS